ncbi:3232_t:CDS:2 [Ambispora leptoticha]|uniref:3232_t:CDS:1 n=1 Tax=Ambispora leptoticha TaxID=144679 RepID=A0A9N8ZRY2_9GLOM|nr:3232_t:CDS:2 [Ambispora leptoticha]
MWEIKTANIGKHILKIDDNAAHINGWLTLVTVLTSALEAALLPLLLSFVWIFLYKRKRRINARKHIPNLMLSKIIGLYEFTEVVFDKISLFNDSDCMFTLCTSQFKDNFALVSNLTTIRDIMHTHNVSKTYWNLGDTNFLYAVRAKTDVSSCIMSIGTDERLLINSSVFLNVTSTWGKLNTGHFAGATNNHSMASVLINANIDFSNMSSLDLHTLIQDSCDIPMNMFYISPNFSSDVVEMAKSLEDAGYHKDPWRYAHVCMVSLNCSAHLEWKQMRISGNTPDTTKILEETNFNNSIAKLNELFLQNVPDYSIDKEIIGENEYDSMLSQALASSIQSIMNNVSVSVDKIVNSEALGLWIELTVVVTMIFLISLILLLIYTSKNMKWLLPLSLLNFGIISNAIFREGDPDYEITSWPFELVDSHGAYRVATANEIEDKHLNVHVIDIPHPLIIVPEISIDIWTGT